MEKKKILFVYSGYEQGAWGNIAYPCNFHYYIMPGILNCVVSLKNDPEIRKQCEIKYKYFNKTVEKTKDIFNYLTEENWDLVGFSSYCWNIEDNLIFARKLKETSPQIKIMLGGPEIFMKNQNECSAFFHKNPFIDTLVFGDAEEKLPEITKAVLKPEISIPKRINGYAFSDSYGKLQNFNPEQAVNLNLFPSIYPFEIAIPHSKESGLAMVYETGRGCPYNCIYCKFGHKGNILNRIDISRVKKELKWLISNKIECIHFADAVFDIYPEYAKDVCRTILDNNIGTSIFFYCSFFKLDEELACLFAKIQCQIGVGIQSTNPLVLKTIRRTLSPDLFKSIKKKIKQYGLNFYIDLIFGLPNDTPGSFANSFNLSMELEPSFVMIFPLSLVKDTVLAENAGKYGVIEYSKERIKKLDLLCDIQYENIGLYKEFTEKDLISFDNTALALFYFYNRFFYTLSYILKRSSDSAFSLYRQIGHKTKEFLKKTDRTASNANFIEGFQEEIFSIFAKICKKEYVGEKEIKAFRELFKIDILRILILISHERKKLYNSSYRKREFKTNLLSNESEQYTKIQKITHGKIVSIPYNFSDLLQLSELRDSIQPSSDNIYMYAPFNHWNISIYSISPLEKFLIELIPGNRGIHIKSLLQAAKRQFRSGINGNGITPDKIKNTLKLLEKREIILIYIDS